MRVYNVVGFGKDSMNQYLEQIDNDIAAKNLLKHPFYLAWTRGKLSKEALVDYARQYYYHVAAFPMSRLATR
jgi:pyrroloquinoline quinone (PQQ) biosynthesis protein C